MTTERKIIGAVEPVTIRGAAGERAVLAKVDTGASRTTVDLEVAALVGLGPVRDTVRVRTAAANHSEARALVDAVVVIADEVFELPVAITDRSDMTYHVIVGMDILGQGRFYVDPAREAKDEPARTGNNHTFE